jgi:hypothetical protein
MQHFMDYLTCVQINVNCFWMSEILSLTFDYVSVISQFILILNAALYLHA